MAVSRSLRLQIFRRDNHTCQSCGAKAPDVALEVDHVLPVTLGGSDEPSNLRALCEPCNSGKAATPPDAATVEKVSGDAVRWAAAQKRAAEAMTADLNEVFARRQRFLDVWNGWTWDLGNQHFPLPPGWEGTVDRLLAAGLAEDVLHECVAIGMRSSTVKVGNKFRYTCGVAWNKVKELQRGAADIVGAPTTSPAAVDHLALTDSLYALTQPEIEMYGEMAQAVLRRLNLTGVDEDTLAGAIAEAEIEYHGRHYDLVKEYLESDVEDGMRFHRQAYEEWLKIDHRTTPEDPEVWDRAAKLVVEDELVGQRAWSYFSDLAPEVQDLWVRYCETAGLAHGRVRITASRLAYEVSQSKPIPSGMCVIVDATNAIGMCFNGTAFRMSLQSCPACPGEVCQGGHQVCEHHLEMLMDGGVRRTGAALIVQDYTAIHVEN